MLCFIAARGTGELLCCAGCGAVIAHTVEIRRILGRSPRRAYVNPQGIVCPLLTLANAEGLHGEGEPTDEATWFPGYAWLPVSCEACGLFLGWRYEAQDGEEPAGFYGLLEDRLRSRAIN